MTTEQKIIKNDALIEMYLRCPMRNSARSRYLSRPSAGNSA
jgi:hypothetical protein